MSKNFVFYAVVLVLFGTGIYFILSYGSRLQPAPAVAAAQSTAHVEVRAGEGEGRRGRHRPHSGR